MNMLKWSLSLGQNVLNTANDIDYMQLLGAWE